MNENLANGALQLIGTMRGIAAQSTDSASARQILGKLNELERLIKRQG